MATDLSYYAPFFKILIADKSQPDLQKMITSIEVDERLDSPNMFKLGLSLGRSMKTQEFMLLDNELLDPLRGQEVKIYIGYTNNPINPKGASIAGKIVAINPSFPSSGVPHLSIEGYDHSFFMQKAAASNRVRYDKCKNLSDVLSQIASSNGLKLAEISPKLQSRSPIPPGAGQSDYDYLRYMAENEGFEFFVRDRMLHFRDPKLKSTPVATLTWGKELVDFTPRLSTAKAIGKLTVQYPNSRLGSEKPFKGVATSEDIASPGSANGSLKADDGGEDFLEWPVKSDAEAKSIAESKLAERNSLIEGTCECIGMPWIRPGMNVRIAGVGKRFSRRYYVTGSRHSIGDGGFTASFELRTGSLPSSQGTLVNGPKDDKERAKVHGAVSGKVIRVEEEDHPGMAEVKFRWSGGSLTSWARVAVPAAGKDRGFYFMPEVGDEVLLAFDHGDASSPYVIGSLWNAESRPPQSAGKGGNDLKCLKLRSGHILTFNEEDNNRGIEIKTSEGKRITLSDSEGKELIEIADSGGKNFVRIDPTKNEVVISSQGKLTIKAPTVEMQAQGSMSLKTAGTLTIQGAVVKIN